MKILKVINDELIEIREYVKPNACFQTNEYTNDCDFCILREQFNPFDLFNDNKIKDNEIDRLNNIINELENDLKKRKHTYTNMNASINGVAVGCFTYVLKKLQELKDSD